MAIIRKGTGLLAVVMGLAAIASNAVAGGFAIGTQSGSGTGNAYAGGAAAVEDAGVVWSNPAGMAFLPAGKHVSGSLHALLPSFKFQNQGSTGAFGLAGTGEGGDGGDWNWVPNTYFAMDVNPQWRFGVGLNAPFGLKTEYDNGWRGRLIALKSEIKSINVNPALAVRLNDVWSLGAGVNVQKLDASLTNCANLACTNVAELNADDFGYGFNVGLMAQISPQTRIGATYRSAIRYQLEGDVSFSGTPAGNGGVKADLKVPDMASLSFFHALGPKWELMGDVTWTGWSSVQQLVVQRTTGPGAGATLTTLPFQWKDVWRFGVGANYRWSGQTKLRFGLAMDESPTSDATRTPRLPDEDRKWVAVGVQHRVSKSGTIDVGYAHEFVNDARIRATAAPLTCPPHCLSGSFENQVNIFSIQYAHSF